MSVDVLGTSCDQCRSTVQYSFTSTETRRLVRTDSSGRPPRLSHSSWTMIIIVIIDRFYIAPFSAVVQTHCTHVACDSAIYLFIYLSTEVVYWQRYWVVAWPLPRETAAVSANVLCTPFNHAPVSATAHNFTQSSVSSAQPQAFVHLTIYSCLGGAQYLRMHIVLGSGHHSIKALCCWF